MRKPWSTGAFGGGGAVVPTDRREANGGVYNFVVSISKTVLFCTLSEEEATEISELQTEQLSVPKCRQRTDGSSSRSS